MAADRRNAPVRGSGPRGNRVRLALGLWVLGVALLGPLGIAGASAAASPARITFALDWVVAGRHAPYFVALDRGFYRDGGLDVTIVRGYGSTDAIKQVASGKADFAFGDLGSLLIARARQQVPVQAVAVIYSRPPFALYSLASSGITSPKDLEGKTIAAPAGDAVRTLFPVFAKANGLDPSRVRWLTVDATGKAPTLFARRADLVTEFAFATPVLAKLARENGQAISVLYFSDYGVDIYSNGLLVGEPTIRERPQVVRAFVQATLRGLAYTLQRPDDATALMVAKVSGLDPEVVREELAILEQLVRVPEVEANGLGYIDAARMARTAEAVALAYELEGVRPEEAYTNEFLR